MKKVRIMMAALMMAVSAMAPAAEMAQEQNKEAAAEVKPVSMKLLAKGDNPGVGFKYLGAKRTGENVVISFELPNKSQAAIENVWLRNYENDAVKVTGPDGIVYPVSKITMAESESGEGLSKEIPAGGSLACTLTVSGVPQDVTYFSEVLINSTGQAPMDCTVHRYSFIVENCLITAPPVKKKTTGDGGKSVIGEDGKVHPGKSGGIYNPALNMKRIANTPKNPEKKSEK